MNRTDWIRIRSGNPEAVRHRVLDLSERCEHDHPLRRKVRLGELADGLYSLEFSPPLIPTQFTNLMGHLIDDSEVNEVVGWMDDGEAGRVQLKPGASRSAHGETMDLVGITSSGVALAVHLPDGSVTEGHGEDRFEEPPVPNEVSPVLEWEVTMDSERPAPAR